MEPHVVLSRSAARKLLAALLGPGYLIRELQAIGDLDPHNPIIVLREAVERPVDYVPASEAQRAREEARALALEDAARAAYGMPSYACSAPQGGFLTDTDGRIAPGSPYDRGAYDAAARIRALATPPAQEETPDAD